MTGSDKNGASGDLLARIADALERLAPAAMGSTLPAGDAFVWEPAQGGLIAVDRGGVDPLAKERPEPLAYLACDVFVVDRHE